MSHDPFPREPLTPDEQALARRLEPLGPHGEPSPALDARILAAARATPPERRPRRWPVALGVAASLVLAVGIAWRLRPLAGPSLEMRVPAASAPAEQASGAAASATVAREVFVEPPTTASRAAAEVPRVGRLPAAAPAVADSTPAAPPEPVPPVPMPAPPAPVEPALVLDAPSPAPAPAISALPAPPASARAPQPEAGLAAPEALGRKAAPPASAQSQEDGGFDAAAAANDAVADEPGEDVPPATADAPAVREAWLQRIRELLAEGRTDAARASLREFVRRHPDAPLPDDLRALAK